MERAFSAARPRMIRPMKRGPHDLTLAILAGGKGTRLGGVPKGLLVHQGRAFVERLLDLKGLAHEALIISGDERYDLFGVRRVEDVEPGRGAPGGVVTALLHASTPWVVVVACDMPFIDHQTVEALLQADGDHEVCCYRRHGELEPLLALYRASLGAAWRPKLGANPSLRSLLKSVKVKAIESADPRALDGINTPAELEEVES